MTATAIKAESVSKVYQKGAITSIFRSLVPGVPARDRSFYALEGVSFELRPGETLGVIGPNGAGKSTLLKILSGVTKQTSGSVIVSGRIAPLIELGAGFHPELTASENIFLNGAILGMRRNEIKKKFGSIVDFAELWDFIDTPVKKYSSGMLVRLGFAIAIHLDPDVLLVDEVLAVGDIQFQSRCFRKISEFREAGKAIVLVTHDMGAILQHCERVIVLKSGKVVAEEPAQKAVDRYLALLDSGSKAVSQDVTETPMVGTADRLELAGYRSGRGSGENIEHDLCSMRPGYNRTEFRYGSGKARIIDFAILDAEGRERTHFRSGEAIVFRIRCRFYQDVENPIFGFFIRTVEGIEIYNTNTLYKEMNLGKIDKNEELNVEYRQMPNLQAGSYFLSAGIAQSTANEIVAIDRRYNLAAISILPVDKTTGIVNLHTEIRIYREDHSV